MKNNNQVIVIVTPQGIGGITTMAESIFKEWSFENPKLVLFRVPRHSFRGWLEFPVALVKFLFLLTTKNVKVCQFNLSTGGSPLRKLPFIVLSAIFDVAVVLQIHSGKFDYVLSSSKTSKLFKAVVRLEFKRASGVIALNNRQIEFFQKHQFSQGKNIIYIPNAVKISTTDYRPTKSLVKEYDFVFVGRFSKEKGALDLVDALAQVKSKNITLAVVGANESFSDIDALKKRLYPHRLVFFGEIPGPSVSTILSQSRVLVLPSYVENFPIVVLEAFRARIPVIATPVGQIPLIVQVNQTGMLVPVGDTQALSNALQIYSADTARSAAEGNRGFERLDRDFNIRDYPKRLLNAYSEFGIHFEGRADHVSSED